MSIVKLNNQAVKNASSFGSISSLGSMVFIKKLTASSSATISFVDGTDGVVLDDTYKEYVFTFKNIHPANDGTGEDVDFTFQVSTNTGSSYGVAITNTHFRAFNYENASGQGLGYLSGEDFAQSTSFINVTENGTSGGANDEHLTGTFHLFNPSSTTFVKHFISRSNKMEVSVTGNFLVAGYCNVTASIDGVQFKMSSGNIDSGVIKLYGVS